MQNIQDLKEKIFFESRNIIGTLDKINHADELASCQDLVSDLAERIALLSLLEKHAAHPPEEKGDFQPFIMESAVYEPYEPVTEEEAIFNNEFNEIPEYGKQAFNGVTEEEAIFNNQLNEIVENELHETVVNFVEEHSQETPEDLQEAFSEQKLDEGIISDEETEPEPSSISGVPASKDEIIEEEAVFNNQLNEIDGFENEISDEGNVPNNNFEEEERIRDGFDAAGREEEEKKADMKAIIPSIFDTGIAEHEILIEESDSHFTGSSTTNMEQGEMVTETSSVDHILSEIKNEPSEESVKEQAEVNDKRKITDIFNPHIASDQESMEHNKPSDKSFEDLDAYQQEKKIRLAHIKGMKAVQSLFDDDHLQSGHSHEKNDEIRPDAGSILKTNIPTNFMEAEKPRPQFKLDLNDRIAFTKMLFGGSQTDLNEVIGNLNSFKSLEEAKEYLSDLYYERKWNKVDEYAQRLWILVENKFI